MRRVESPPARISLAHPSRTALDDGYVDDLRMILSEKTATYGIMRAVWLGCVRGTRHRRGAAKPNAPLRPRGSGSRPGRPAKRLSLVRTQPAVDALPRRCSTNQSTIYDGSELMNSKFAGALVTGVAVIAFTGLAFAQAGGAGGAGSAGGGSAGGGSAGVGGAGSAGGAAAAATGTAGGSSGGARGTGESGDSSSTRRGVGSTARGSSSIERHSLAAAYAASFVVTGPAQRLD